MSRLAPLVLTALISLAVRPSRAKDSGERCLPTVSATIRETLASSDSGPPTSRGSSGSMQLQSPRGMQRVRFYFNQETQAVHFVAPEITIPSPIEGHPDIRVQEMPYTRQGRGVEQLAQEASRRGGTLILLGEGGTQKVFADPFDRSVAIKVYDPDIIWKGMKAHYVEQIKKGSTHAPFFKSELEKLESSIPRKQTYPPEMDRFIALMVQRQVGMGRAIREEILPELNRRLKGIRVTMVRDLEHPSEMGVTRVERLHYGPINPMDPRSPRWVDPKALPSGDPLRARIEELSKTWEEAWAPFNMRLLGTNARAWMPLKKGGLPIEFDVGVPRSRMSNTAILFDHNDNPIAIKITDF